MSKGYEPKKDQKKDSCNVRAGREANGKKRKPNDGRQNSDSNKKDLKQDGTTPENTSSKGAEGASSSGNDTKEQVMETKATHPNNDIGWYVTDDSMTVAQQTARLSFNQIAGVPFTKDGIQMHISNIIAANVNPCPGVTPSAAWGSASLRKTGLNQAAYQLFELLNFKTGRVATYGPQDIVTMLLAFGEVISMHSDLHRMFTAAFAYKKRNWAFPTTLLVAMNIDIDDFITNYAEYTKQFNRYVTTINRLNMFRSISYFDKCEKLYRKLYYDNDSSMAQVVFLQPATVWELDDQSYPGGSLLVTNNWHCDKDKTGGKNSVGVIQMSAFLKTFSDAIDKLVNSQVFVRISTDIMNYLKNAVGSAGIHEHIYYFDYWEESEVLECEYDPAIMQQIHAASFTGTPHRITALDATNKITPYNDVYPDANQAALIYNPAFGCFSGSGHVTPTCPKTPILDMVREEFNEFDVIEATRYMVATGKVVNLGSNDDVCIDNSIPDHYIVGINIFDYDSVDAEMDTSYVVGTSMATNIVPLLTQFDWCPVFEWIDASTFLPSGHVFGDLNFFATVPGDWLKSLNEFIALNLFILR